MDNGLSMEQVLALATSVCDEICKHVDDFHLTEAEFEKKCEECPVTKILIGVR